MSEKNLFEQASREKFRFNSPQGALSVEDLWDLPLTSNKAGRANLDDIAIALDKEIKDASGTGSFVNKDKRPNTSKVAMLEIVKRIIEIRQDEVEMAQKAHGKREMEQKIMEIMAKKTDQSLESKSLEELQAMLKNL